MLISFSLLLIASLALLYVGKLALIMHKALPAYTTEHLNAAKILAQLIDTTHKNIPTLHIIEQAGYNAFSTRYGHKSAIAITQDLIHLLSENELKGVLAHEIAHLNLHQNFSQRLQFIGLQLGRLLIDQSQRLILCCLKGQSHPIRHLAAQKIKPTLKQLSHHTRFQAKEFQADAYAAKLCGSPEYLATALKKIEHANHQLGINAHHTWQSSHPPVSERIRRLEAIRFGAYI